MRVTYALGPRETRVATVEGLRLDEPIFVLRAQDAVAVAAARLWLNMASSGLEPQRLARVLTDLDEMIRWRRVNSIKDAD